MGVVMGLPVGLSIIGPAWSEARLLSYGYAYERASELRDQIRDIEATFRRPGLEQPGDQAQPEGNS